MHDLDEFPCAHPADAPVLPATALSAIRCHAHYCPRCGCWFRLSDDYPEPRQVHG